MARLIEADRRLERVFAETFDYRRKEPGDDVVSHLLAKDSDQLAPAELVPLCMLLLLAGFETTVNLIGNAVLALLARPDQWLAVVQDPSLAGAAIEETLRWDPPVQRTVRAPMTDLELAGVDVPQGSMVVLYLAGANRDPAAYDDPDRFDLWRTEGAEHLAFSAGIHYCLGAPWPGSRRRWPWSGSSNASPAAARRPTSAAQRNCHPRPRRAGGHTAAAAAA